MTREEYLKQRNELMNAIDMLIGSGQIDEANAKMAEVEVLDGQYEAERTARANAEALRQTGCVAPGPVRSILDIAGEQAVSDNGKAVEPENAIYERAFYNYMTGRSLTVDEQNVFDRVNEPLRNSTQTVEDHQILVPESTVQTIWMEMERLHPIIADVGMTHVPGDIKIIKDDDSAGTDAEWITETDAPVDDAVNTSVVELKGHELVKSITISWKLKKMSMADFLNYIAKKIARKMGNALAAGFVVGKGTPGESDSHKAQPLGIVTALEKEVSTPQVVTYSTSDALTFKKVTEAFAKIRSGYISGAAIYSNNKTIWETLANMMDGNDRPYFIPDPTSGGVGRMFGLVVKEESAMPDGAALIGCPAEGYTANVNENITMYTEDHVKARATDYMGYTIIDGTVLDTKAFALVKKS